MERYGEVTLQQMLDAREKRVRHQRELIERYRLPLLCFTMNIAGPVKNSDRIRRGFSYGLKDMELQCLRTGCAILHKEVWDGPTGNEAFLAIDAQPEFIKALACELEDADELGRLYDMDVLEPAAEDAWGFRKLTREQFGLSPRKCLICGRPAAECASRRVHSAEELSKVTREILRRAITERTASKIAELAVRSLLYEVATTPKPGLVDRVNNGSHKDMDFYSFLNSAAALRPYFEICARAGSERAEGDSLPDLFEKLRLPGKLAENGMLRATGGINTHKGAIFSMGILCAAVGAVAHEHWTDPEKIGSVCAEMTKGLVLRDFQGLTKEDRLTAGQRLYLEYGVTGVRGQMEEGLPAVLRYGLPALEKHLADGKDPDEAGAAALLSVMANMTDTNLIARSDLMTQRKASSKAGELVRDGVCPGREAIEALDREFIDKNLSPGGSADMLALCWMLHFIKEEGAYDA